MKKILAVLMAALIMLGVSVPAAAEFDAGLRESVVVVATYIELDQGGERGLGWGTGFFVGKKGEDPDSLITNHHVIESYLKYGAGNLVYVGVDEEGNLVTQPTGNSVDTSIPVGRSKLRVYYDSQTYEEAYAVEYSEDADVAVLRLDRPTDRRSPLPLRSPGEDLVGSTVYAIGYPGLAENIFADSTSKWDVNDATVTKGAISRMITTAGVGVRKLQVDIDFNQGNSGGPLLTEDGYVVGINTSSVSSAHYSVNIDEAITLLNRNGIPYESASEEGSDAKGAGGSLLAPVLLAVVALVAVAGVVLVLKKKKKPAPVTHVEQKAPTPTPAAVSDLRLQGVNGIFAGRRFSVNDTVRMGRDPARNDLVFPGNVQGISGAHCIVTAERGGLVLRDLKSTYGTFLGGRRVTPNQPVPLKEGDRFYLGSESQMFQVTGRGGV